MLINEVTNSLNEFTPSKNIGLTNRFDPTKKFRFRFDGYKGTKEKRINNQIFEWNPDLQEFIYISPQGIYQQKKDPDSGKMFYHTVSRYSDLELSIFNKLGWRDTSPYKKELVGSNY